MMRYQPNRGGLAGAALGLLALLATAPVAAAQSTSVTRQDSSVTQSTADSLSTADSTRSDSTKWGYPVDSSSKNQNPAGYRGMERPTNLLPDSGMKTDSSAPADATSRINQRERQDSLGAQNQNPPGYRGMERPTPEDSSADSASQQP